MSYMYIMCFDRIHLPLTYLVLTLVRMPLYFSASPFSFHVSSFSFDDPVGFIRVAYMCMDEGLFTGA